VLAKPNERVVGFFARPHPRVGEHGRPSAFVCIATTIVAVTPPGSHGYGEEQVLNASRVWRARDETPAKVSKVSQEMDVE
jgi:hypothetical protein